MEIRNFDYVLKEALERSAVLIATCRAELEYKKAKNAIESRGLDMETLFDESIELGKTTT